MTTSAVDDSRLLRAGSAATQLIADPKSWINRRVETVELLAREQTRRRVSIDFTLSDQQLEALRIDDGVAVPISPLTKQRLRAFDLRDESGAAIPVLGKAQNGELALIALLDAVASVLPLKRVSEKDFEAIVAQLRQIVFDPPDAARAVLEEFADQAAIQGSWHAAIDADQTCRALLDVLWANYALFAVLSVGGPNRRILKYGYGDDVDLSPARGRWNERIVPSALAYRFWYPDRQAFDIRCSGAAHARSFHAEIVIPEELRFSYAVLLDSDTDDPVSDAEIDVNRAALHASEKIEAGQEIVAAVEIAPEGRGRPGQASATSIVVAAMLWLGVASGLDAGNPDAAVSILLGGAALFSGVTAVLGEPRLVSIIFSATRRWLFVVALAALAASASLAMAVPDAHPVVVWLAAATACTLAAVRLTWSSLRARA